MDASRRIDKVCRKCSINRQPADFVFWQSQPDVINLGHMRRGGVYPLPAWVAFFAGGDKPLPYIETA